MGAFIILLFVPMLIQHIVIGKKYINSEKRNGYALLVFFFLLAILIALRHKNVGSDTKNYIYFFRQISKLQWSGVGKYPLEIGFLYFNKIISVFVKEPQIFFAITACGIIAMIYPTYKRVCVDASLTIVIFCIMSTFVMMFSGVRQMIAVAIGILAYECTRKKKYILYVICVLLAMSFHTSAFMLAFMYPLYHTKITKKWLMVVVPVIMIVFIFNSQIFSVLSLFLEKYTEYDASAIKTSAYTTIILFALFAVFAFLVPDEDRLDAETIGMRNFLLFSLVLQMFAPLHTIAMRMNYYYIIFIPLLIPRIIAYKSAKWRQVAIWSRYIMLIFFLAYFFISASNGGGLRVFPYHFFWEEGI